MRWLALALACLGWAGAAHAQDTPPDWVGVWEGTLGRYPVVACLDERYNGEGQGSYYYLSQLKAIPLESAMPQSQWAEGGDEGVAGSQATPGWDIARITPSAISGTWRAGKRSLPIALTRIPDDGEDYDGPCASRAFFAARLGPASFREEPRSLDGFDYTERTFEVLEHFEDLAISGFAFEEQQPGDRAIAVWLDAQLPQGRFEDEFIECLAGGLMVHGYDGYYEKSIAPVFANDELMAVAVSNSTYCGGAHPNHWQTYASFDHQNGAELDPASWFDASGLIARDYGLFEMTPALRAVVMRHWAQAESAEDDCAPSVSEHPWWNYQLRQEGMMFQPDLPHVATICEERVVVPWEEIGDFLSPAGVALRERAQR